MAGVIRLSTLDGYRRYIDSYIKPHLGKKQISKITPADIQNMYNKLRSHGRIREHPDYGHELSTSTIRSIHAMFHGAMKAAEQARLIAKNPTEEIMLPKATPKQMQILNDAQLDRFIKEIKADTLWYNFFYTEITTGLRVGELCGLMWSDFDADTGTLSISRTIHVEKGGKLVTGAIKTGQGTRKILLPASIADLLRERKKTSLTEWIFPNPAKPEVPTNPRSAYQRLKAILKSAGLPNIRFHDLRHTFASNAIQNGVDIRTVSSMLGHADPSFTLRTYTHTSNKAQEEAAQTVGQLLAQHL